MSRREAEQALMRVRDGEYVVVFDGKGRQLGRAAWTSERSRNRVRLPAGLAAVAAHGATVVVTHNHMGGTMLSVSDVRVAFGLNLKEIRAVCPDGRVWSLRRTGASWGLSRDETDAILHDLETIEASLWSAAKRARDAGDEATARKHITTNLFECYQEYLGEAGVQGVLAALRVQRDR
jgi:hypothetical protein